MPKLDKLIGILNESKEPELIEFAARIHEAHNSQIQDVEKEIERMSKYCIDVSLNTDMDFYIDNQHYLSFEFLGNTRQEALDNFSRYFHEEANYSTNHKSWDANIKAFKEDYVDAALKHLKNKDFFCTGGNWEFDIEVIEPKPESEVIEVTKTKGVLRILGVDFQ